MENTQAEGVDFKFIIGWWERKRLLFNLLLVGLCTLVMYAYWDAPMRSIIGTGPIIVHVLTGVLGANILYTAGWFGEVVVAYLFDLKGIGAFPRWFFFVVGTLGVLFVSFVFIGLEFDVSFNK